ncbi:AMP-binding protein [candidate division KSB1 bacterium]|nr:AMP-binding protein [candidate division KSB1 bacterium]
MPTLVSQLYHSAQSAPSQRALVIEDTEITYHSFINAVKKLAGGLVELGIEKGDRVAILLPNVPHFCISYYAILAANGIAVPLNFMHNAKELEHQLKDSGAKILIVWQAFLPQVLSAYQTASTCVELLVLGDRAFKESKSLTHIITHSMPLASELSISESDVAVINYTSGIADEAMGAELTHEAILFNANTCIEMLKIGPQDKVIAVLPLFHPLGQTVVMHASLAAGATLVILPRFKPAEVIETIQKNGVTFMPAVPGMFRALLNVHGNNLAMPSLKYCMCYGGHLADDVLYEFENKFNVTILKAYGLTEAGPLVSATRISRDRKSESTGLPLMGVELQVRDSAGRILFPNQSGEIFVKSPSLMKGYWDQPKETERRLKDGWLATGDIGYLDLDHYLFIQERKDDIITKGGFAIHSREVENIILDHPAVDEVAVVGMPDPVHGAEVKAFVVLAKGASLANDELFTYCQNFLPVYKCPRFVETVAALPKSPTGRVLKRFLRQKTAKSSHEPVK